jgi:DNA-binding response OmpR family regulator
MKKQARAETNPISIITVLSVSPLAEDHLTLQAVFKHSEWELYKTANIASALAILRRRKIGVVICEHHLSPGTWIDLLELLRLLPDDPPLIVTSRLADERFWAEALNLGAHDVLAKPFERTELVRSVESAWLHWRHRHEVPAEAVKTMRAAGQIHR